METLLRKYMWAIDLAVVVVAAVFAARATSVLVESGLIRSTPPLRSFAHVGRLVGTQASYDKDFIPILKRNVFCSTCPPIIPEEKPASNEPAPPRQPVRTMLPLKLLAIMYSPPPHSPYDSIAVVSDTEAKVAGPYRIGEKVRGATLVDIQETRIYLDNAGRPEFLDLLNTPEPPPGQPTPAAPAAKPATDPFTAELERGIKRISENQYEVQRGTVDSLLGNMAVLARSARIVPEIRDGKAAGFRLFGVRPEGPFAKIGLQNGDVIYAINGLEMTSPDKALEIYMKLKSANHLSVALERSGTKITKDYNIR